MCEMPLHAYEIYYIMFFLPTEDVLRCMQVCKYWKSIWEEVLLLPEHSIRKEREKYTILKIWSSLDIHDEGKRFTYPNLSTQNCQKILLEQNFWRRYVSKHFDLELVADGEELEGPLCEWADETKWFCYYEDENDPYVVRPFPSMLKCGVVIPFGLDLLSFDTKHLQGLSRSLEILTYMREGVEKFELMCGNECSLNEGCNDLSMVLIPWDGVKLPTEEDVFTDIFHFHPEILENMTVNTSITKEKLYFHAICDHDPERDEERCLNRVFGRGVDEHTTDEANFFTWLQNIMVPTCNYVTGDGKLNPVVHFCITTLAPGWVGGVLTGQTWT